MLRTIRLAAILSVSSLAILAVPFAIGGADGWNIPGFAAHAEKGGNGGGNGGGGGSDGSPGGSGESHGKSAESHGNSAKSDGGADSGVAVATASRKTGQGAQSEQNLHAQLAGLNSLKRNVNGLMNSADPRMEGIREFVLAGAALEGALDDLEKAKAAYEDAKDAYFDLLGTFSLSPYDDDPDAYSDVSVPALEERLADLRDLDLADDDPDYDAWLAEIESLENAIPALEASEELAALTDADEALDDAAEAAKTAEGATDDEALKEALLLAANDNRVAQYGDDYVTDDILDWAKSVLGVGDANGAIDAYLKQQ